MRVFIRYLQHFILAAFLWINICYTAPIHSLAPLLILNVPNKDQLPRNFRTCRNRYKIEAIHPPSRLGLNSLCISGSAQFSEKQLKILLQRISTSFPLYIIDLRQESHGFLNGAAVSWYIPRNWINVGKRLDEIEYRENQKLRYLLSTRFTILNRIIAKDLAGLQQPKVSSFPILIFYVATEKELVKQNDINYCRIPVTDHCAPSNEEVDHFMQFIRSLSPPYWLHFHCAAGRGRTTTFMAMYDMLKNAKQVSFEDIIARQTAIGGINLSQVNTLSPWKSPYSVQRLHFLRKFYVYCQQFSFSKDESTSWSNYLVQILED